MTHTCFACHPDNPERIFTPDGGGWLAAFARHYNGPPGVVNGGVAAGALACPAMTIARRDGARYPIATRITARLRRPVPVGTSLRADAFPDGDRIGVTVALDGEVLASGGVHVIDSGTTAAPGGVLQPEPEHLVAHIDAMRRIAAGEPGRIAVPDDEHPFPTCFSCGPANTLGLRIKPRIAADRHVWAAWQPMRLSGDADGTLPGAILGAALDCSNAMALSVGFDEVAGMRERVPILGAFDMHVLRVLDAGAPGDYRIVSRATGVDGRKYSSVSALFDATGAACAVADTTWVVVPRGDFGSHGGA
jgi:hypothetical protein